MQIRFEPSPDSPTRTLVIEYQPHTESAAVRRLEQALGPLGWVPSSPCARPEDSRVCTRFTRRGGGTAEAWTPAEADAWVPEARRMLRSHGYLIQLPGPIGTPPAPVRLLPSSPTEPPPGRPPSEGNRPGAQPDPAPSHRHTPASLPRDPVARIKARFAPRIDLHQVTDEPLTATMTGPVMATPGGRSRP